MAARARHGGRIRRLRQQAALTQRELARRLAISPSYLNLIEHDRRPLTPGLLLRLGELFKIDPAAFSDDAEARLLAELREVFADPALAGHGIDMAALRRLVAAAPALGAAICEIYRSLREARSGLDALSETLRDRELSAGFDHELRTVATAIRSFAEILQDQPELEARQRARFLGIVAEESRRLAELIERQAAARPEQAAVSGAGPALEDFLQDHRNHFPEIEAAAEETAAAARLRPGEAAAGLAALLARDHKLTVEIVPETGEGAAARLEEAAGRLRLAEHLPPAHRAMALARCVGRLRFGALFDRLAKPADPAAAAAGRAALAAYFGRALLMPYERFLADARGLRHDLERLGLRYGVALEDVCHRLASLNRPGARGIPFHLLAVDMAGNLLTRFSASGLRIARYSGVCPLWNVHAAFLSPGQIRAQLSDMGEGERYFSIACAVRRPVPRHAAVPHLIALELGCDAAFAGAIVYAAGLDLSPAAPAVPVGTTCRLCAREACDRRVQPPVQGSASLPTPWA